MTARPAWRPDDVRAIAVAVQRARRAVQESGSREALDFARAFVAGGGIRIPSAAPDDPRIVALAGALLASLGGAGPRAEDPDLRREVDRVRKESALAAALAPAGMVGFVLVVGDAAAADPACQFLLGQDFGLGAAVFPRSRVAVLPPWCLDYGFVPLSEHEVEQ